MKKIIYVHGRDYKPKQRFLEDYWNETLEKGLLRDFGEKTVDKFKSIEAQMAYYGDVSNEYLKNYLDPYNEEEDIFDRKECLDKLSAYLKSDFNHSTYCDLPGKSSLPELVLGTISAPLSFFGLADNLVSSVAPDMKDYWNIDKSFGSDVRAPLTKILLEALKNDDEILLLSHSLGTIVSYDVLWKFSNSSKYKNVQEKKVHTWITMGSPLGDEDIKKRLKGAKASQERKHPLNINKWFNVASKDDYIAHDKNISNDFKNMNVAKNDIRNYNLAINNEKSNPHFETGYLISPEIVEIVAEWLNK